MNPEVQIFRYVTEGTFDAYMWQLLENKQKFISQIMTSKSPVRSCEDVDDTALSYAEIKALATGNPYIKEKMDLDVQVSKLRMLKASHVSQIYRLESDIARNYPGQIAAVTQRIANLTADNTAAQPLLEQAKDNFAMTVSGKNYTERKEAGAALIKACTATKELRHSIPIGVYGPFKLTADYNPFTNLFEVSLGNHGTYTIEVGVDPAGNITRINNALENLPKHLEESMRKLETLEDQLENAREEVKRPFPQEKELAEKSARLSELNTLLNMDERTNEAAMLEDGTPETGAEEQEEPAVKKKREEVL